MCKRLNIIRSFFHVDLFSCKALSWTLCHCLLKAKKMRFILSTVFTLHGACCNENTLSPQLYLDILRSCVHYWGRVSVNMLNGTSMQDQYAMLMLITHSIHVSITYKANELQSNSFRLKWASFFFVSYLIIQNQTNDCAANSRKIKSIR